jgi:hypothetical protein
MSSTKSKLRLIGAFAALLALALAVSCRGFFVNPTLTSLAVGPANLSLAPGASYQMKATGTFSDGSTSDVTGKCLWTSSDQSVATFSTSAIGQITAASLANLVSLPGTTSVSASDGTVSSSSLTVTVCPVVEALTVTVNSGSSATITSGQTAKFNAVATFNGVTGTTDVTSTVTWNISNTSALPSIDSSGNGATTQGVDTTINISATLCGFTSKSVTLTTIN